MRAGVDAVGVEVGPPALAHAARERALGVVGVDHDEAPRSGVMRCGREARGLDERVEHRPVHRLGTERADRAPALRRSRARVIGRGLLAAGRMSCRTEPSPNHDGSSPRTIATGTPAALPITSSAAAAISSAIATSVTWSTRPSRVGSVAQVDDRGDAAHADRDVGEPLAPRPPERVGHDHGDLDARPGAQRVADVLGRPVGVDGQQRGPARFDVRQVDARVRAHEAVRGLADDEVAAAAHDAHRLRLDEPRGARRDRRGRARTSRPSAFDTIFCVTTRQSPVGERRLLRRRGVERSAPRARRRAGSRRCRRSG